MKVKFVLTALLLLFILSSTVTADIVYTYGGTGFDANVYYQLNNLSTTSFTPSFNGTAGTDWRVSWWNHSRNPRSYDRFGEANQGGVGNDPSAMVRGVGHWVIFAANTANITFAGSASSNEPTIVPLNLSTSGEAAYTLIGNPYDASYLNDYMQLTDDGTPVDFLNTAALAGLIVNNFAQWRGFEGVSAYETTNTFSPGTMMTTGRGGWITTYKTGQNFIDDDNYSTSNIGVSFSNIPFQLIPEDGPDPRRDDPVSGWDLQLFIASSDGEFLSQDNKLGVREDATAVFDHYDINEINPPTSSYIQLYFPHFEYDFAADNFTHDFRSMEFDGAKEWNFTVKTVNVESRNFTLDWMGVDEIPENYTLTLTDVNNNRVIGDMRDIGQVSFRNGDEREQEFHFRVSCEYVPEWVGPGSSSLPGGFGLTNAYPNPFNNVVNLDYTLQINQSASLKVYDMTGKLVDTISGNIQGEGTVSWNANGMQSGVYMMQLESGNQVSLKKVILMQ
ncbi:MAG: T9SS type A sorting domain-containing protein [Calditrichaeota bacterium]|nr:T9SS type A sorting domain-containing protein [Calditrichota bacterium]MBT7789447.1 T9SS type A sorting domain-containing protein [Calditrichota bacterium]